MSKKQDRSQQLPAEAETKFTIASQTDESCSSHLADELLHELSTHQVELEMQNEKLRSAYTALEASRDRYLQLFDFAPFGYLTLTEDGLITEANLTCSTLLGVEREKLINRRFSNYVKPEDGDHWYKHCLHAKQHHGKQNCELSLRRADGTTLEAYLDCLHIEGNATSAMRITLTDITERKRVEKALRETEMRHTIALACAKLGTWHWNIKTGHVNFSERWAEMCGYRQDEIEPDISTWENSIHPDDLPTVQATLTEHFSGRSPFFQAEYRVRTKSGAWIWILDRGMLLERDDEGKPLRMAGAEMVITERKQAEEAQRIAAAAFETQDGIMVTDALKVILRVNQAFTRITGYSIDESIGRSPSFLSSGLHDEDFYQAVWVSVKSDGYWHGEIWDKRKNGEVFPLWLTLTAVTDDTDEHITHYVGSFTDITVQKQAEKVLLDARRRLENQVATTKEEVEKLKQETADVNTTLNVLLKHRETATFDAQSALSQEIEGTFLPFLKKLKGESTGRRQTVRLINILENNIQQLVKSYGRAATLPAAYQQLTRVEMQVASMVRQGLSTKVIAATLNVSPGTICIHRKHIRKKLSLDGKATNLHSYLLSLTE